MKKSIFLLPIILLILYGNLLDPTKSIDLKKLEKVIANTELTGKQPSKQMPKESINPKSKTAEIIFYLSIDPLFQNLPIAQAKDNSYYLNHTIDHQIDPVGSPFLDYRNHWKDKKLLIYGHNSEVMPTTFHLLERYLDSSFLKEHPYIIISKESTQMTYQVFSVLIVTTDYQHMKLHFKSEEYMNHLNWLKKNSMNNTSIELTPKDEILILQTCYYKPKDSYLLIAAKKISTTFSTN